MADSSGDKPSGGPQPPVSPVGPTPGARSGPVPGGGGRVIRIFGSPEFFRLWLAQLVSAIGDWLGFVAIVALATRLEGATSGAAAVGLVMSARLVPGFFFAPVAGLIVDRWDRKRVMVYCDIARACVLATLPFVTALWQLVLASLALEVATLLWSPAKEASVPNLVPAAHLTAANSLSLVAAYGTFPVATLAFAATAKAAQWLDEIDAIAFLRITEESLPFYLDVLTFLLSAFIISRVQLPSHRPAARHGPRSRVRIDLSGVLGELREGWQFMFTSPVVRAVMVALSTGLIGGGMVVPLGDVFSQQVLGGGPAGFGLLLSALGFGMAGGVIALSAVQNRLPKEWVFTGSVFGAGLSLVATASTSSLTPAMIGVASLGIFAGAIYVLGFTILHESVADELRGRIFSSLNTLVRFCVLLSFAVGPVVADRLGALSLDLLDGGVSIGDTDIALPGVRLALWLAGAIIVAAGFLAVWSLRAGGDRPIDAAAE